MGQVDNPLFHHHPAWGNVVLGAGQVSEWLSGAEERLKTPAKRDDPAVLLTKLRELYDARTAGAPRISRNVAELLGIPLDDPDVMQEA